MPRMCVLGGDACPGGTCVGAGGCVSWGDVYQKTCAQCPEQSHSEWPQTGNDPNAHQREQGEEVVTCSRTRLVSR